MSQTQRIFVVRTKRLPNSEWGNPRWGFFTTDSSVPNGLFTTAPDISDAYQISDGFVGWLTVTADEYGRVTALTREKEEDDVVKSSLHLEEGDEEPEEHDLVRLQSAYRLGYIQGFRDHAQGRGFRILDRSGAFIEQVRQEEKEGE